MARQKSSFDEYWPEVRKINSYAIFMGYLSMGVRGLGLLVLTWTTVVLLGGFVSMLQKKDFWCLTTITLVQTAGVFDFLLKEKASDVVSSLKGLGAIVFAAVFKKDINTPEKKRHLVVGLVLLVVQVLVLVIVLCPLAVLYVLGLYLSAGISLWRLIQHDYGDADGGANLKPALNLLYSLVVAQGVVYGYRAINDLAARTGLVEEVAQDYSLETDLVSEYLEETVAGCMKDPSFARGRNMVTYGVDLLVEPKSRFLGYISGVLILGKVTLYHGMWRYGQSRLMKEHVVQRLVETFGPTSPYSTEIRVRAATIVANVARSIRLDHLPAQGRMMIQCISSLLDTFEEYNRRREGDGYEELMYQPIDRIPRSGNDYSKTQGYKDLVVQGLRILEGLAANEDNRRAISNAQGLVYKSISPLISDRLHSGDHHEWTSMAEESLQLMKRLIATPPAPGEAKVPSEISGNTQSIIRAVQVILECQSCQVRLKSQAVEVLLHLFSVDTHPSVGDVIRSLAAAVAGAENNAHRTHAAMILEHLCRHYTKDDENLKELKKAVANVMPEVLKEIVQVVTEANNGGSVLLAEEGLDLEQGGVPYQQEGEQHQRIQLQQALIDLCLEVHRRWIQIGEDQDLNRQLEEIAAKICSEQGMPHRTFRDLVRKAAQNLSPFFLF